MCNEIYYLYYSQIDRLSERDLSRMNLNQLQRTIDHCVEIAKGIDRDFRENILNVNEWSSLKSLVSHPMTSACCAQYDLRKANESIIEA